MPNGGILSHLRSVAQVTALAGAVGSEVLMLRAGQRSPRILIFLFTIWVLSPFVALAWAIVASKRWSALTRATLYSVTLVVTVCSLAIYGRRVVVAPPGSPNAFVFVVVSPASWLLMATAVPMAAFVSGRRSRRGARA